MTMPPPLEDEKDEDEPEIDVRGIIGRIKKLELGDYLYAIGAGVRAFHDIRKHRKEHINEDRQN